MLDGTLFFVKSARYGNPGNVLPGFCFSILRLLHISGHKKTSFNLICIYNKGMARMFYQK